MKFIVAFLFNFLILNAIAQDNYSTHFTGEALRLDFILAGDQHTEEVIFHQLKKEKKWAGPKTNYVPPFNYGNYRLMVIDQNSKPIYRRGFSTLFEEYQTIEDAKTEKRSFFHTIRMPFPKDTVTVLIQKRQYKNGRFTTVLEKKVNPGNYFIIDESHPVVEYEKIIHNGESSRMVDIVFLAEGYRQADMEDYILDVRKIVKYIFDQPPFNQYKSRFNIYAVKSPSPETGPDIPGERVYRRTALNFSYYTFDLPRYLTSTDSWAIRDFASVVPYDHIFVLINSKRYGGGGFYNHFTATTTDHAYSREVAIHEFGHGFAGLGDEYYSSEVAYSEFYNTATEPWEPNLTTLTDFSKKWKGMIDQGTPIPTPREEQYRNVVGVYEGGGYASEGIYSPYMDCRMKSNVAMGFCPVCQQAIIKMIHYYTNDRK